MSTCEISPQDPAEAEARKRLARVVDSLSELGGFASREGAPERVLRVIGCLRDRVAAEVRELDEQMRGVTA